MTNAAIIQDAAFQLMKEGKIGTTGRMFKCTVQDADGNESEMLCPEPEMIHTFQHWKSLGFKVKKGEHAVARIEIWKHASKTETDENGEEIDKSRMFRKVACFFSMSQVERMEATA